MRLQLEIENIRAFEGPERLAIRPITLLYGPNSGGKSSLLSALLYAAETLRSGEYDIDSSHLLLRRQ